MFKYLLVDYIEYNRESLWPRNAKAINMISVDNQCWGPSNLYHSYIIVIP